MSNLQKATGIFERMPNNKAENILFSILCKLGEIEEELQCNVPVHQKTGCAAHVKGILPDNNIELMQKLKRHKSHNQKAYSSYFYAVEALRSYNNQDNRNSLDKTPRKLQVLAEFLEPLQDVLCLLYLIFYRIYRVFLCIFLHKYVSPCQCPYVKTCALSIAQKRLDASQPKPTLKTYMLDKFLKGVND